MSLRNKLIGQQLAHNAELLSDDRLDFRVIRQCAAVDRDCFKRMIDQRLNVGMQSGGNLFCQRELPIRFGARKKPVTGPL